MLVLGFSTSTRISTLFVPTSPPGPTVPFPPKVPGLLFLQTPHGFGALAPRVWEINNGASHLNPGHHLWKDEKCAFPSTIFQGQLLKALGVGSRCIRCIPRFPPCNLTYPILAGHTLPFGCKCRGCICSGFVGFCLTRPWDALWWSMMCSSWDEDHCIYHIYCQRQAYFRFLGMMNWIRWKSSKPFHSVGKDHVESQCVFETVAFTPLWSVVVLLHEAKILKQMWMPRSRRPWTPWFSA